MQAVKPHYLGRMKNTVSIEDRKPQPMRGQCSKRLSIVEAAADVFCREGFSGASIDEIAARACVSRQTVYNHYHDKETLFVAVVEEVMSRTNGTLFSTLSTFPDKAEDLETTLAAFLARINKSCVCNQDGRFLRRLVQTEGERHPHLFESWRQHGPMKINGTLAALLARLSLTGALEIDDFDAAARQLLALGNADLQMKMMFGETPTEEEIERAAGNAAKAFLRAYGTNRPKRGSLPRIAVPV